jgi:protein-disulfide isomerase
MSIDPRRRRAAMLLAAAALAAAAVAVAAVASSSGGTPPAPVAASNLFRGIPERGGVLGDPNAPVTVTEFVDLQCTACAAAARATLPQLVRDQVRTGQVKLEARTLQFLGPDSDRAARFAAGAAEQGRLWPFLEAFYSAQGQENSGYVTDEFLRSVARAAGVDADAAFEHAGSASAQDALDRANADAQRLGIQLTPTFTVARGDAPARVLAGNDAAAVAAAIRKERAR